MLLWFGAGPSWRWGVQVFDSFVCGTSHVRILWPVKLMTDRNKLQCYLCLVIIIFTSDRRMCMSGCCTSHYRPGMPGICFPPQRCPSQVWQETGCRLLRWTQRFSPFLMTCKDGNFCSWCRHLHGSHCSDYPGVQTGTTYKEWCVKCSWIYLTQVKWMCLEKVCGFSYRDQQRDSPVHPCFSPWGSWGLLPPASAS